MRTGDLLALRFFLLPADCCLSDHALKYLNFVLKVRCKTQHSPELEFDLKSKEILLLYNTVEGAQQSVFYNVILTGLEQYLTECLIYGQGFP